MSVYRKTRTGGRVPPTSTPQSQPIKGFEDKMKLNDAGGYTFTVTDKQHLERFLILGTAAGTYYCKPQEHTDRSEAMIRRALKAIPQLVLNEIERVSVNGLALKNDPALFALALATTTGDADVTRRAMELLPSVARTGTDLLHFTSFMFGDKKEGRRGIGRAIRRGYLNWFSQKPDKEVVFQTMKYRNRDGFTMGDVISITHLKPWNDTISEHFKLLLGKEYNPDLLIGLAEFSEKLKGIKESDINAVIRLVLEYNAPHELWPTEMKNKPDIWGAVLMDGKLPMRAMLRNLVNMANYGVFKLPGTAAYFCERMVNETVLAKSRIHPLAIYQALAKYSQGNDMKRAWGVSGNIEQALNDDMNLSFKFLPKTGKKYLLAVDSSGSMDHPCFETNGNIDVSCRTIATICALSVMRAEGVENTHIIGFDDRVTEARIHPDMGIKNASQALYRGPNATNCSLPMIYAREKNLDVDVIALFTDNQSWAGDTHAAEAMAQYRRRYGPDKKWVVSALVANDASLIPQDDLLGLNIAGASIDLPIVIQKFSGASVAIEEED